MSESIDRDDRASTVTTAEGLTALLYHIAHSTSQGQLDPDFSKKLGKRIVKEAGLLTSTATLNAAQLTELTIALEKFNGAVLASEGGMLCKALKRLRDEDDGGQEAA